MSGTLKPNVSAFPPLKFLFGVLLFPLSIYGIYFEGEGLSYTTPEQLGFLSKLAQVNRTPFGLSA